MAQIGLRHLRAIETGLTAQASRGFILAHVGSDVLFLASFPAVRRVDAEDEVDIHAFAAAAAAVDGPLGLDGFGERVVALDRQAFTAVGEAGVFADPMAPDGALLESSLEAPLVHDQHG